MLFSQGAQPSFEQKEKKKAGSKKNPFANQSVAQLKESKEKAIAAKDLASAAKYLDAMRIASTDQEVIKDILLEMADIYFELQEWVKAEKAYNEFILLYPGAVRFEYAYDKAIACGLKLTLDFDRDQTKTQEVLKLANEFIAVHPTSEFKDHVQEMADQCHQRLLESDIGIFKFYLKSNKLKAAQIRLDTIGKEHIPFLPDYKPQSIELRIELAQAKNDTADQLRAQIELATLFPENDITKRWVTDIAEIKTQLASLEKETSDHAST